MKQNPLITLEKFGQSVWLDFIRRGMISSGEIGRLIEDDGLSGVTVNPTILDKAISGSHDYDQSIRTLALDNKKAPEIYESLAVEDVQNAAGLFRPVYDRTRSKDGYVSLEVSPYLAHDTKGTISEAHRFWSELSRPDVMIKVPATSEGLAAIQQLTAEGINVNVTLLFGLPRYRQVVEAYISGLEQRLRLGKPVDKVASVASFFLSRIDVLLDPQFEKLAQSGGDKAELAKKARGQVAIASARLAYQIYKELFGSERFQKLAAQGAQKQRLLWASTGTKNPAYSDVMYVEALIGPETVNTMPLETIEAYRDHGDPALRLEQNVSEAQAVLSSLSKIGIDLDQATQKLEDEGVDKFIASYDQLMEMLQGKIATTLKEPVGKAQ